MKSNKVIDEQTIQMMKTLNINNNNNNNNNVQRTTIKDILTFTESDNTYLVSGWIKSVRVQGNNKFCFVELNDGSTIKNLQIIVDSNVEGFSKIPKSGTGASLSVLGSLKSCSGKQTIELHASHVTLLGTCDVSEYPLAKKNHTLEYLRDHSHLRPRTKTISSVARIRNALSFATHTFFQSKDFMYVHTPIITASDCEGAGEMFSVTSLLGKSVSEIPVTESGNIDYSKDFFGEPSYLTVSGQLNGENYACALGNIYTFGPTFRAENSHTTKHLAEFWMIEPEMAFVDLPGNMEIAEGYLKFCLDYVLQKCKDDLEFLESQYEKGLIDRLTTVLKSPFKRVSYTQAVEDLLNSGTTFKETPYWGIDLTTEHERYLTEQIYKQPIIVYNYPKEIKSFYMKLNPDGKTVAAMDILVPRIGEIIGGSQREENLNVLEDLIKSHGLEAKQYESYLDLRRFGTVIHSGFGLGFERLVMFVTGIENIRDVIPFPRFPGYAKF